MPLDATELEILEALQLDGRMTNAELAKRVGLSDSPCFRRVKRLEQEGIIRRYAAVVDQTQLGLEVTAFVEVTMERQPDAATEEFHARVRDDPHIIECHAMSGSHDYLMKVVARNMNHFSHLVMHRILKFPGVLNVQSSFSLSEVKVDTALPAK